MNPSEHTDKRKAIAVAFGVVLLLGLFFYWLSGKQEGPEATITALPVSSLSSALGRDLLVALAKLKSTKLDTSIFTDPLFTNLRDFGVEIPSQPVGRRNPFASFEEAEKTQAGGSAKPATPTGSVGNPDTSEDESFLGGFDLE